MTTATARQGDPGRPAVTTERRDLPTTRMTTPTGWYDPDGAGWESEATLRFESFRAAPGRAGLDGDDAADEADL